MLGVLRAIFVCETTAGGLCAGICNESDIHPAIYRGDPLEQLRSVERTPPTNTVPLLCSDSELSTSVRAAWIEQANTEDHSTRTLTARGR